MQIAVIEFARNVCGLKNATSTEFDKGTSNPVISMMEEQKKIKQLGGPMRLGTWVTSLVPGTKAHDLYRNTTVSERHRHRYEANVHYLDTLRKAGLVISALTQREHLTEIVELPQSVHPWFMGVQFHPEFKSTPWDGHPLFNAYIKAALDHQSQRTNLKAVA